METAIETAIRLLAEKIAGSISSTEAMQFTQAALNLAHTAQVVKQTKLPS